MKKLLVVLLAAAMSISLLAGCTQSGGNDSISSSETQQSSQQSSQQQQSSSQAEQSSSQPSTNVTLRDFTCLGDEFMYNYFIMNDTIEEFTAWQELRKMMEARNINLVPEFVADDQYQSMLQTRFAAMNEIPMFCFNNLSDMEVVALAGNGQILDILPIIEGGDGTAKAFFENEGEFGLTALNKVRLDGHIWWLPNLYITNYRGRIGEVGVNVGVNIRYDWLEKYGLSMPTTLDEFTAALKTFNENDPSEAGVANVPGYNVYSYNPTAWNDAIAQWFGLVRGNVVNVNWDTDEATSPWVQPTVTDYFNYIIGLREQGLYDEEMVGSNDTLRQKATNDQVGASTLYATSSGWEPLIEHAKDAEGQVTACYAEIYPIEAVPGVTPFLALEDPVYMWQHFVFTNVLTDTQLGADFLDVYYSDESIDLINYGVEGVNYEIVNGEKQFKMYTSTVEGKGIEFRADQQNKYIQEKGDLRISYGKHLYSRALFPDMTYYMLGDDFDAFYTNESWAQKKGEYGEATMSYGHFTSIDVEGCLAAATAEESEKYNDVWNDLYTQSQEYVSGIVLGQRSVDEIPTMVETLNGLGLQDVINIFQARHDRFIGK